MMRFFLPREENMYELLVITAFQYQIKNTNICDMYTLFVHTMNVDHSTKFSITVSRSLAGTVYNL